MERSDSEGSQDEGRSLLSARSCGSQHDSRRASWKLHDEPASQHASSAAGGGDSQKQGTVQSRRSAPQDSPFSSTSGSAAGPPSLAKTSFVKNPGLSNIQTPFSSCEPLFDHALQPLDRPQPPAQNRLESIAGIFCLPALSYCPDGEKHCSFPPPGRCAH